MIFLSVVIQTTFECILSIQISIITTHRHSSVSYRRVSPTPQTESLMHVQSDEADGHTIMSGLITFLNPAKRLDPRGRTNHPLWNSRCKRGVIFEATLNVSFLSTSIYPCANPAKWQPQSSSVMRVVNPNIGEK